MANRVFGAMRKDFAAVTSKSISSVLIEWREPAVMECSSQGAHISSKFLVLVFWVFVLAVVSISVLKQGVARDLAVSTLIALLVGVTIFLAVRIVGTLRSRPNPLATHVRLSQLWMHRDGDESVYLPDVRDWRLVRRQFTFGAWNQLCMSLPGRRFVRVGVDSAVDLGELERILIRTTGKCPSPPSHCEKCGYSLHGLPIPRCPECGTPFDGPDSLIQS